MQRSKYERISNAYLRFDHLGSRFWDGFKNSYDRGGILDLATFSQLVLVYFTSPAILTSAVCYAFG